MKLDQLFLNAFQYSTIGMALVSIEGQFIKANQALCDLLGYSEEELVALDFQSITYGKDLADDLTQLERLIKGEIRNYIIEKRYINAKGNLIWAELSVSLVKKSDGSPDFFISQIQNINERKLHEERLRQEKEKAERALEAKTHFLSNMSHEIRTPLNAILGFTEVLLEDEVDAEKRSFLDYIKNAGDGLLHIINDILEFSKLEAGKMKIKKESFSARTLIEEVEQIFKSEIEHKSLEFNYFLSSSVPEFLVQDAKRLRQILINIIGNSVKFTDEGSISVSIEYENGRLSLCIEDTGIGIPGDKVELIKKPFVQVENVKSSKNEGTGLGLSICQRLLDLMGGELRIESTYGEGTIVTIDLSAKECDVRATSQEDVTASFEAKAFHHVKALIVEDNDINTAVLYKTLSKLGFQTILTAKDGLEGVKSTLEEKPDIVFMDIQMPNLNGLDATVKIREDNPKGPVIIGVSANAFSEDRDKALDSGMNFYISKPIQKKELMATLMKTLSLLI